MMFNPEFKKKFTDWIESKGSVVSHHLGDYKDHQPIDISPQGHSQEERIALVRAALADPRVTQVVLPPKYHLDKKSYYADLPASQRAKLQTHTKSEDAIHIDVKQP